MKSTITIFGIIGSIFTGFLFAGIIGAVCFAVILTLTIYFNRKNSRKLLTKTGAVLSFFIFFVVGYFLIYIGGLIGADKEVLRKLDLIKDELKTKGYKTSWVIISQKRSRFMNNLLTNSAKGTNTKKESYHISGKAIDIYVFDIDGDNNFDNKDIKILEQANKAIESKNPSVIGAFGDYYLDKHDYFTKHMIHIDIRGEKLRYTK